MSRPCPNRVLKKGSDPLNTTRVPVVFRSSERVRPLFQHTPQSPFRDRPAFTLIEMMVVISIMLILTAITFTVINVSMNQDRISDSGRTIQAFLEGARDRAIHAGQPRGVRFILDPTSTTARPIASSMVYIGAPGLYGEGLVYLTGTGSQTVNGIPVPGASSGTGWRGLIDRGRLVTGARIQIPKGTGNWYTISLPSNPLTLERFNLTRDFIGTLPTLSSPETYRLELTPAVLPGQQPRPLARGIMIDLLQSQLPGTWAAGTMDILFSPRGTVTGPLSGFGMIHLVLADVVDVENGLIVGNPNKEGGELIVTVTTQTGNISTHHVDTTTPGDPFRFAEIGEAAK